MSARFTLDGSDALENHLAQICRQVVAGVQSLVPPTALEGIVLGGGYGRGEGGVFKTESGDRPYNDLEFYVFTRGNALVSERRYRKALHDLGERLSPEAGLHVEFKVFTNEKWRTSAISMFTYDLAAGHRVVFGNEGVFSGGGHHLLAGEIPLHEATRLLFNRCSGLLLCKDYLLNETLTAEQTDFIGRNLAKAQMAFGDAVLTVFNEYHWSCRERDARLNKLPVEESLPWLAEVRRQHAIGVEFKLHPQLTSASRTELKAQHAEISELGRELWLWLESRRLNRQFFSVLEYALARNSKSPETAPWRNGLLTLRTFGPLAMLHDEAFRYPRERLFNALCLLLWDDDALRESRSKECLRNNLRSATANWRDLLASYRRIWQNYG